MEGILHRGRILRDLSVNILFLEAAFPVLHPRARMRKSTLFHAQVRFLIFMAVKKVLIAQILT